MENIITIEDKRYPELLRKIGKTAPKQLYYKGNISLLQTDCLAVVGSRRMTTYGRQTVEKLITQIASAGITIVSGFMYGVDATAHKAAVDAGGKTIAAMPCGIDLVHPEEQVKLYDEILESDGLIISEYEGRSLPALYTYPARNRIVAGLSKAVLVVEAAEKSGSLITANLAKRFKRKLFAVPGPVTSLVSVGTNQLIRDGAEIVTGAEDILRWFGAHCHPKSFVSSSGLTRGSRKIGEGLDSRLRGNDREGSGNDTEVRILKYLQNEPMEMDLLGRRLNKSIAELSIAISMMEMGGRIKNINGKYYVC